MSAPNNIEKSDGATAGDCLHRTQIEESLGMKPGDWVNSLCYVCLSVYQIEWRCGLPTGGPAGPPPRVTVFWPFLAFSRFSLDVLMFRPRRNAALLIMGIIVDVKRHIELCSSTHHFFFLCRQTVVIFGHGGNMETLWTAAAAGIGAACTNGHLGTVRCFRRSLSSAGRELQSAWPLGDSCTNHIITRRVSTNVRWVPPFPCVLHTSNRWGRRYLAICLGAARGTTPQTEFSWLVSTLP